MLSFGVEGLIVVYICCKCCLLDHCICNAFMTMGSVMVLSFYEYEIIKVWSWHDMQV